MALATTLSKDEVQKSLKMAMKRTKKNIPPPKYLCTPSSHQIQQKVITMDKKHDVCDRLNKMMTSHGSIPKLRNLSIQSMKKIYTDQNETADCTASVRLTEIRRFAERYLKDRFLEDSSHRTFWKFVHIGVNSVLKRLENLQGSVKQAAEREDPCIVSVLLDAGWLKSQLGHHIVHLCAIHEVRLISFRPTQTLAKLISSDLYTVKRAIAVGVSVCSTAPLELQTWFNQVCSTVPLLAFPHTGSVDQPKLPVERVSALSAPPSANSETQLWENYAVDYERLYLPVETPLPPNRVITLREFWQRLSHSLMETVHSRDEQLDAGFLPLVKPPTPQSLYAEPIVRTVPVQTEAERQKKKAKKRFRLKNKDSYAPKKLNKEKKNKKNQKKTRLHEH